MDPRTMDVNLEEHEEADLNQKKDFTTESTESTEGRISDLVDRGQRTSCR
jgi:hypothetical protein